MYMVNCCYFAIVVVFAMPLFALSLCMWYIIIYCFEWPCVIRNITWYIYMYSYSIMLTFCKRECTFLNYCVAKQHLLSLQWGCILHENTGQPPSANNFQTTWPQIRHETKMFLGSITMMANVYVCVSYIAVWLHSTVKLLVMMMGTTRTPENIAAAASDGFQQKDSRIPCVSHVSMHISALTIQTPILKFASILSARRVCAWLFPHTFIYCWSNSV